MMQYLGIIEQRTNEILQLYAATQAREGVVDAQGNPVPAVSSILGQGPQLPAGRNNITIQPPSATDEAYDSEEPWQDALSASYVWVASRPSHVRPFTGPIMNFKAFDRSLSHEDIGQLSDYD